jgi:periplasmic divalent cation tolerance protein
VADYLQVLTTTEYREDADRISRSAVEARLAACAQVIGPIVSTYRWEGAVETAEEWQVLLKTAADRYDALEAFLREQHSYELPEVIATPIVAASAAYLSWIREQTRGDAP